MTGPPTLLAEMDGRRAERTGGDLDQPAERLVELENHEDCA